MDTTKGIEEKYSRQSYWNWFPSVAILFGPSEIANLVEALQWLKEELGISAFGISFDVSSVMSLLGNGGGTYFGYNLQYTDFAGWGEYKYRTPDDIGSMGFLIGPSLTFNVAWGTGPWTGLFNSYMASASYLTGGLFLTPMTPGADSGYAGFSFGVGKGLPGFGATTTDYESGCWLLCRLGGKDR